MSARDSGLPQDLSAPGGSGSGQPPPPATVPVAAVDVVTLKSHFKVPEYSGLPKGTTFQGATGVRTEMLTVQAFSNQVDTIMGAAKWDNKVTAQYVKLAFLPDSPVQDWAHNNHEAAFMKSWDTMRPELSKAFAAYVSVSDRVQILRSFKQKSTELSYPYLQRITKEYNRFVENLESDMVNSGEDWAKDDLKDTRQKIARFVTDFHLKHFFALGLKSTLLEEVTKAADATSLEKMADIARKAEQAELQSAKRSTIGEISATPAEEPIITDAAIIAAIRRFAGKTAAGPKGARTGQGQAGQTGKTYTCHYCQAKGHLANVCRKRQRDRGNHIWRQKINDPPTSKAEWERARAAANAHVNTVDVDDEDLFASYFAKNE